MSRDQQRHISTGTAQLEQQNPNSLPNAGINQNGQAQNNSQNGNSTAPSANMSDHWQTGVGANPLTGATGEERPNGSK
ncbi:hypothetical protein PMIN03_011924 [Paraphaeosphaeria minitans]